MLSCKELGSTIKSHPRCHYSGPEYPSGGNRIYDRRDSWLWGRLEMQGWIERKMENDKFRSDQYVKRDAGRDYWMNHSFLSFQISVVIFSSHAPFSSSEIFLPSRSLISSFFMERIGRMHTIKRVGKRLHDAGGCDAADAYGQGFPSRSSTAPNTFWGLVRI